MEQAGEHFSSEDYWENAWDFEVDGRLVAAHRCHDVEMRTRDIPFPASLIPHTVMLPSYRRQGLTPKIHTRKAVKRACKGKRPGLPGTFSDSFFRKFNFRAGLQLD